MLFGLALAACGVLLASVPGRARAQAASSSSGAKTLLLVRTPGDAAIASRVSAELTASAWRVVQIGPDSRLARADLAELASAHDASAALRVDAAARTMQLWIAPTPDGRDGGVETLSAADPDERVPALRVTEALRARGLIAPRPPSPHASAGPQAGDSRDHAAETPSAPAPKAPAETAPAPAARPAQPAAHERGPEPVPHPAAAESARGNAAEAAPQPANAPEPEQDEEQMAEAPSPARPRRFWIELAPAFSKSPGGLPGAFEGWLDLRVQATQHAAFGLFALAPLSRARLQNNQGSARLSTWLVGAGADLNLRRARWELGVRAGAGVLLMSMNGSAAPATGLRSAEDSVLAAAVLAGPSAHLALGAGFGLCARVFVGAALPRVAVRFAGEDVAHWGRPFALATLGVEYGL